MSIFYVSSTENDNSEISVSYYLAGKETIYF